MSTLDDRVGLGWRGAMAASILGRLAELDVLEVIAEDWLDAGRREMGALRDLASACPIVLHGVSLGLASSEPVEPKRLAALARLLERTRAQAWSEHLAFVRSGGVEIGHLAAPPRTPRSVAAAVENIGRARRALGAVPCVENIATLIDPPASSMQEGEWTSAIVRAADAPLLLDLHNLYANAVNFGASPSALLRAMPLEAVRMVHLAGGRWIDAPSGPPRLLDDHLHDVPGDVYALLEELASLVPQPLTVLVERDGRYPAIDSLLAEVAHARAALRRGRFAAQQRMAA